MNWADKRWRRRSEAQRSSTGQRGPIVTSEGVWISIGTDQQSAELLRSAVAVAQEHHLRIVLVITPCRHLQRLMGLAVCGCLVIPGEMLVDHQQATLERAFAEIPTEIPVTWRLTS